MNKEEFLSTLRNELQKRSLGNIENMIEYYDEMICDRIEDGMNEEEAVASMDSIEEIVGQAVLEKSIPELVINKVDREYDNAKKKGNKGLWIALAILGFPIWLPLLCVLFSLLLCIYTMLWVLIVVIVCVVFSFALAGLACILSPLLLVTGWVSLPGTILGVGAGLLLGGIIVLLWKPTFLAVKYLATLPGKFIVWIKKLFV